MKKLTFILALTIAIITNAQTTGQFTTTTSWSNFAGSQTRSLVVYVPTDYNASNTYKLIIGFHGLGDTPDNFIGALIPYATDAYYGNVIVVATQYSDWDENLYDDGIVPSIISTIDATYNIDAGNIYLEGFSVGGISSTYRGLKNSDIIKGIITNSGAMAGPDDVNNICTTGACKDYDYTQTNNVFACFTSSPDYEQGVCSGAVSPCDALEKTFYYTNLAASDKFNSYTSGSSVFIDNPNNCHCLPTVEVNHQCWDHVSQIVSTTNPVADFAADNTTVAEGSSVIFTDNSLEGGAAITTWNWTFTGGTPSTFTGQNPPAITYNTAGTYEVSLTVTNSFGNDTEAKAGYITVVPVGDIFSLDFELPSDYSLFYPPWSNYNNTGINTYGSSDFDFPGEGTAFGFMAFNPVDAAVATPIATAHIGDRCGLSVCPGDASATDNWLISDKFNVGTSATFTFWVLTPKPGTWGNEIYNVLVSTTDNNFTSFTAIASGEEAPSSWTQKSYDLSAYSGQDIYVAVQHVSIDKFLFFIDDVEIIGATTDNKIIENANIVIYPNPTNDIINITNVYNSNIEISDINGRIVIAKYVDSNDTTIDLANIDKGTYFVKIISNNNVLVKKIIVK